MVPLLATGHTEEICMWKGSALFPAGAFSLVREEQLFPVPFSPASNTHAHHRVPNAQRLCIRDSTELER